MAGKGRRAFGSVRQLGSGRWQARYLDAAGVRHTAPRTFPTKVEATRSLAQVEADLLRGSWADPKLGRVTFGEWVEQWRPTTANLRPGTLVLYDYLLRRFLLPAFEAVPLGRLDTMTVRAWLASLHRAGEVTPTTMPMAYRLLRHILNVAVEAGFLPPQPLHGKGRRDRAGGRDAPCQHPTAPPARRRGAGPLPGARVQVVEQAAEVAGEIIVSPPKNDAGRRVVTLPKLAVEALAAHLEECAEPDPDGLVFTTPRACICCAVPSTGSCGGQRSSKSG